MTAGATAATLERNVVAFAELLRKEFGFAAGPRECIDALRALGAVGLSDRSRVQTALRIVFCATWSELEPFDRAFESFFLAGPRGVPQDRYAPRQTQPPARGPRPGTPERTAPSRRW